MESAAGPGSEARPPAAGGAAPGDASAAGRSPAAPPRPWLALAALFALFLAGGPAGWALADWAAPGSGLATAVSGMLLPAGFALGLVVWAFLDAVGTSARRRRARRSGGPAASGVPAAGEADPSFRSARFFVPIAAALAGAGGFFVGLLPAGHGVLACTVAYGAAGAVYGRALAAVARSGHLPPPEF